MASPQLATEPGGALATTWTTSTPPAPAPPLRPRDDGSRPTRGRRRVGSALACANAHGDRPHPRGAGRSQRRRGRPLLRASERWLATARPSTRRPRRRRPCAAAPTALAPARLAPPPTTTATTSAAPRPRPRVATANAATPFSAQPRSAPTFLRRAAARLGPSPECAPSCPTMGRVSASVLRLPRDVPFEVGRGSVQAWP